MNKKEAASFLGVSVRALERYAGQGRLSTRYAKGKTRPVVVYDDEELTRLKSELDARRPLRQPRPAAVEEPTETVGFRLDAFYRKRLSEAAAKQGMSAGEYARHLVIRALEEDRGAEALEEISELRRELALSVKALLCFAGKADLREAEEWVAKNLKTGAGR